MWTDWANEDMTKRDNSKGWSFRLISVVNPQEGLVFSGLSLEHIQAAQMAGLSVGIFSPCAMSSSIALYASFILLYVSTKVPVGFQESVRSVELILKSIHEQYFASKTNFVEFKNLLSTECLDDLYALAEMKTAFRKKLSNRIFRSCTIFQRMTVERQKRLDYYVANYSPRIHNNHRNSNRANDNDIMRKYPISSIEADLISNHEMNDRTINRLKSASASSKRKNPYLNTTPKNISKQVNPNNNAHPTSRETHNRQKKPLLRDLSSTSFYEEDEPKEKTDVPMAVMNDQTTKYDNATIKNENRTRNLPSIPSERDAPDSLFSGKLDKYTRSISDVQSVESDIEIKKIESISILNKEEGDIKNSSIDVIDDTSIIEESISKVPPLRTSSQNDEVVVKADNVPKKKSHRNELVVTPPRQKVMRKVQKKKKPKTRKVTESGIQKSVSKSASRGRSNTNTNIDLKQEVVSNKRIETSNGLSSKQNENRKKSKSKATKKNLEKQDSLYMQKLAAEKGVSKFSYRRAGHKFS